MTKAKIVEYVVEKAGVSKASAESAFQAVLDSITSMLKNGEPVVLPKFGTLVVKTRAARKGRNPKTGEPIDIKAAKVVSFKAGKALKDAVREETT